MDGICQDVRYAVRGLRQNPGFAAAALSTIALAIGATTAMFTIVNGVLLRDLPYPESDRLVRLYEVDASRPLDRGPLSLPDLDDWQARSGVFAATAGYTVLPHVLQAGGEPQELPAAYVTESFFGVLGAPMLLGRALDADDVRRASRNVVISNTLWRSAFGGDERALGTSVSLQGAPFTIVGVAGAEFRFPEPEVALWIPQTVLERRAIGPRARDDRDFAAVARLRTDVSLERAMVLTRAIAAQLADEYPATNAEWRSADVVPLRATIVGHVERALWIVLGVVGLIALIACVNVANLLLARAAARSHEIAARLVLGASRMRIVQQTLTESCVLSLLGGALGVGIAVLGVSVVVALNADTLPRVHDVRVDRSVLAFAVGASFAAGLLIGSFPTWRIAKSGPRVHIGAVRGAVRRGHRLRGALVAAEVALSVVLVVGALLMSRSFLTLRGVDSGFDPEQVLTLTLQVNMRARPDTMGVPEYLLQRRREITERVAAVAGVAYAAMTSRLPLRDGASAFSFRLVGASGAVEDASVIADARNVSRDYFRAMGIPLLQGTTIAKDAPLTFGTDRDRFDGQRPIVVSASAALRFWPGESAIGKVIDAGWFQAVVVGVAGDVRHVGLAESPGPTLYFADGPQLNGTIVVRAVGDPLLLAGPIREAIRELDPAQSIRSILTLSDVRADSIAPDRFFTVLYVAFGALALVLAGIGVYGVVAYTVRLRTPEIGLRVAVGARYADVLRTVVGGGMRAVLGGVALGLCAALLLARVLEGQLYEVGAYDPLSFVVAVAVLVGTAAFACYLPARNAARIDPVVALRQE